MKKSLEIINNMENNKKFWFFGSKLNTFLLLILIILMVIALRFMYKNQDAYQLPFSTTTQN